ncbi:MAG TPA: ESPR-type extended signal peptide-containing protein, partial [Rhodanobacteraceae bacterium]|nr:ESPR-type extended signal peptide-containing protein [Rhodanobacteraceae bacterium]HET7663251.1 ESPR-type extended signal peptide-containing protein [Rhodanobacteraceae bacterium]
MNKKIYSLVWNKSLRQIVVASELASVKSGGGSTGETSGARRGLRGAALCAALALCLAPWSAALAGQTDCSGATAP